MKVTKGKTQRPPGECTEEEQLSVVTEEMWVHLGMRRRGERNGLLKLFPGQHK